MRTMFSELRPHIIMRHQEQVELLREAIQESKPLKVIQYIKKNMEICEEMLKVERHLYRNIGC